MKTYARDKKKYAKTQVVKTILGITLKQAIRLNELKEKGLVAKDFYTFKYDEYKTIILDLKVKGLIQ